MLVYTLLVAVTLTLSLYTTHTAYALKLDGSLSYSLHLDLRCTSGRPQSVVEVTVR